MNRLPLLLIGIVLCHPCFAGAADVRLTDDSDASTRPVVCIDASNNAVIVWEDDRDGNVELYFRRFSRSGIPLTPEVRITNTASKSALPDVSCDGLGNSYMIWQEGENANGVGDVYYAALDQNGNFIVASTLLASLSGTARISTRPDGTSDMVYHRFTATDQYVYFVRMSPLGESLCEPRPKFSAGTIPGFSKTPVVVALVHMAAIFWQDMNTSFQKGLWNGGVDMSCGAGTGMMISSNDAVRPDAAGSPTEGLVWRVFEQSGYIRSCLGGGASCVIAGTGSATQPRVASDGNRRFLAWQDGRNGNNDIYMCRYDETCPSETGDVQITSHPGESRRPDISAPQDGSGEWVMVWQDNRDGNWEIYMSSEYISAHGALVGTITDAEDSSPIFEATVDLRMNDTVIETATTNEDGAYSFQVISPGIYDVRVVKDGYRTNEKTGISVAEGIETRLDVGLVYDYQFTIHIDPYGNSNDPANQLRVQIEITNTSARSAAGVAISVIADGEKLGITETFPILIPGESYSFERTKIVAKQWLEKEIFCVVENVNGIDLNIEESINVSVIYPVGADSEPFDIESDAYEFPNTTYSFWENVWNCNAAINFYKTLFSSSGLCFGMASSSAAYFEDPSLKPISVPTSEMNDTDDAVMDAIETYHITQAREFLYIIYKNIYPEISLEMHNLENLMKTDNIPIIYLNAVLQPNIFQPIKSAAHSVAAYRMTRNLSQNAAEIRIYENLYNPDSLSHRYQAIKVDYSSDEPVDYKLYKQLAVFETVHIDDVIDMCDLMTNASSDIISYLYDNSILSFFHLCPVTSIVTDNYGRRIGFVESSTFINEIPDASVEIYQISESDSAVFYNLPLSLEYTVAYSGVSEGTLESYVILPNDLSTAIIRGHDNIAIQAGLVGTLDISTTSNYVMELDYDDDGTIDESIPPTIDNIVPTAPKLLSPMGGNNSGPNPEYIWTSSIDIDGDSLWYHFVLASDDLFQTIITDTTVTDTVLQSLEELPEGEYYWKVIAQDARGLEKQCPSIGYFVSILTSAEIPNPQSQLTQSYPNPFNPRTTITYTLESQARVVLAIYDISGKLVKLLVDGVRPAGIHNTAWDGYDEKGNQVASGVYFCRMKSGPFSDSKKLVLIR